jgi:hypothetical protein
VPRFNLKIGLAVAVSPKVYKHIVSDSQYVPRSF